MRTQGWRVHPTGIASGPKPWSPPARASFSGRPAPHPGPSRWSSRHPSQGGRRMTTLTDAPSSTIPLAGRPRRSGRIDGSDFLPYPKHGPIDHNEVVSVGLGRRPRTMAGAAQNEGASRLRIQHSPQSEEERGVKSALRGHPYWVGQKGFEGFMPLTRWSEGVPHRGGREESGDCPRAFLTSVPLPRSPMGATRRARPTDCRRMTAASPR